MIDPLLESPGVKLRLGSALAEMLMATPEFRAVHMEPGHRELRALTVAGQLIDAMDSWLVTARITADVQRSVLGDER